MHRARPLLTVLLAGLAASTSACTPSSSGGRQPVVRGDPAPSADREPPVGDPSATADDQDPSAAPPSAPIAISAPKPLVARPIALPAATGPYRVRVVDASHRDLPTYFHNGRAYVMGTVGARYSIVVVNPTAERVEAVVSVDGLDAIDGKASNFVSKRGYILAPHGDMSVDGFRTSMDEVATFRFSSVADSYAGRLGQPRDIGVIGVAFFPEKVEVAVWQPPPPMKEARRSPPMPMPAPAPARSYHASNDVDEPAPAAAAPPAPPRGAAQPGAGSASDSTRAPSAAAQSRPSPRPGLGTEFGEARESRIGSTSFDRANPSVPSEVVSFRYNDREGLAAAGIVIPLPYADDDTRTRETAEPFRQNGFAQPPPVR